MTEGPGEGEPPGSWLQRQRRAAGLTQEELAWRSGLSVRAISNLERDRTRNPRPRSVRMMTGALGLTEAAGDELLTCYRARWEAGLRSPRLPDADGVAGARPASPGRERGPATSASALVPRQLPHAVGNFVGRRAELELLTRLPGQDRGVNGAVTISAIGGTAGVGKTALAVYWAHQAAGRFPDGQLYVNLRGFDLSGTPATPAEAVRGFLDALGVPADRIPRGLDAQAGLYRSLLAGKQVLIVLDNARDERQIRPLLPASPGCLVIVTSRNQLTGLAASDGARLLSLDVLTDAEARHMLAARIGEGRAAAEPAAAAEIAGLCAHLPLALAIAAARAAARPRFTLAALADELRDIRSRLDALASPDLASNVRAVFSWSGQQLSPAAARMFRLLGAHPGPDISAAAAASLAGVSLPQAGQALNELTMANLVAEHEPGRYAFHDLLRAYAAEQVRAEADDPGHRAAIHRVLDYYLYTAAAANRLLNPARDPIDLTHPSSAPGRRNSGIPRRRDPGLRQSMLCCLP